MPGTVAKRLCPDGIFVRGSLKLYAKYSSLVTAIIAEEAPVYEKARIEEFYFDLSGVDTFFDSAKIARKIGNRIIKQTGLPISFGIK